MTAFVTVCGICAAVLAQAPGDPPPAPNQPRGAAVQPVDVAEPLQIEPLPEPLAPTIDELIPKLGVVQYQAREEATRRLIEIGAPAFTKLRDAYRRTGDLEVRMRIERVVHKAYFDHHIFAQKGFLGVSLMDYEPEGTNAPSIPRGTTAVRLTNVIEDTAAFRADLQIDDLVIAVDGEPIVVTPEDRAASRTRRVLPGVTAFSRKIAAHRPGERIDLRFLRGREVMDVGVILGRVPDDVASRGSVTAVNEAIPRVRRNFDLWWRTHFHRDE